MTWGGGCGFKRPAASLDNSAIRSSSSSRSVRDLFSAKVSRNGVARGLISSWTSLKRRDSLGSLSCCHQNHTHPISSAKIANGCSDAKVLASAECPSTAGNRKSTSPKTTSFSAASCPRLMLRINFLFFCSISLSPATTPPPLAPQYCLHRWAAPTLLRGWRAG